MTFELVDFSTPLVQGFLDILGETHFLPPPQPLKEEPKVPAGIHLPSDPVAVPFAVDVEIGLRQSPAG